MILNLGSNQELKTNFPHSCTVQIQTIKAYYDLQNISYFVLIFVLMLNEMFLYVHISVK